MTERLTDAELDALAEQWPRSTSQPGAAIHELRELRAENERLRAALEAARAWDECSELLPASELARIRGEFDAALASVKGETK